MLICFPIGLIGLGLVVLLLQRPGSQIAQPQQQPSQPPIDEKTDRSQLTAFISKDDGRTWGGGLLLDERAGVSYPDGQEGPDGLIRIIYDFIRTDDQTILMAAFREEDAAAGAAVSGTVKLRQLVSRGSGG